MEDSGYYSRRSDEFKFQSGSSGKFPSPDDIFNLKFKDLKSSKSYRYFRHGFKDEEDFEEFKQDLKDFKRLKREVKEEVEFTSTKHSSRCSGSFRNSIHDPLMEFFKGDEHFQEFERVYETINSRKRFSSDFDNFRWPGRPPSYNGCGRGAAAGAGAGAGKCDEPGSQDPFDDDLDDDFFDLDIDKSFIDFFDNDEDFMEFEKEFEKFKSNRRSRVFEEHNYHSNRDSCDIFADVKAFCDRSLKNVNSSEKQDNNPSDMKMWNSAEEWDFVMNKLKRNSQLFSDKSGTSGSLDLTVNQAQEDKLTKEKEPCTCEKDCQYTCHHKCVPSVTLDCTSVVPGSVEENTEAPATETSLTEPKISRRQGTTSQSAISTDSVLQSSQNQGEASSDNISARLVSETDVSSTPEDNSTEAPADNTNEKDETDSGYRSGTIPDEKLPKIPSQATLNREELKKKIQAYNKHVAGANFELEEKGETFQGFIKVTLNLIRPITMSLGSRPPSIYELLTKEHIVEQNTLSVAFYMPRDTVKSIHVSSTTTTKEVVASLLKKFHILDHPRKFAMYEQEFSKNKLVKLKRIHDKEFPLTVTLNWDPENISNIRLVLQENETGEIVWDGFSLPELSNFLRVLDREEEECVMQLQYKYKVMKRIIHQRLKEIRKERKAKAAAAGDSVKS